MQHVAHRILSWKRIAVATALGVATTLLVALAYSWPEPNRIQFHVGKNNPLLRRIEAPRLTLYQIWYQGETALPAVPSDPAAMHAMMRSSEYIDPTPTVTNGNFGWLLECNVEEWGWPMRCLWTWHARPFNAPVIEHGPGISIPAHTQIMPTTPRSIPLMPMWTGLAINTAIFGGIWWFVFSGIAVFKATRRARRGGCVNCGYDLRGSSASVCPECGHAIKAA